MRSNIRSKRLMFMAVAIVATAASAGSALGTILFEDHFDGGVMSPEWVSKMPSQWVEDGWLHNRDTDGWPRDAMATVHDSDPSWTDYEVAVRIDPLTDATWDYANLLLRTDKATPFHYFARLIAALKARKITRVSVATQTP